MPLTVRGTVLQTPTADRLEVLDDVRVHVDDGGGIAEVSTGPGPADVVLGDREYLLPGLVDLHVHAPQWPQAGTGLDLSLAAWLEDRTFPLEARYTDPALCEAVWPDLVRTLCASGTTTAVYYATVDVDATSALARTCADVGQRALVGRVAMDHPDTTPAWYRDPSAAAGVDRSAASIAAVREIDAGRGLVAPIVTPRFVPACTDELLAGLGELAAATGERVQTHCSESDWEHGHVLDRFGVTDATVLDRFGLLRPGTVLAHCPFLPDQDLDRIVASGAGVAHCPESNAYFANAVFPARRAMERGAPVGIGSDVSGGPSPVLLRQVAAAVTASRYLDEGVDPLLPAGARGVGGSALPITAAFWMATRCGADLLGLPVGEIAPGRRFDAMVVRCGREGSPLRCWEGIDDAASTFEKIVRLATADDITAVWIDGKLIGLDRRCR